MWNPLTEAGCRNLDSLHCSCLHTRLAAYLNILRRDLNTTCITINRGVWSHGCGTNQEWSDENGGFWSKPSVNVEIKTTWKVVSTGEVLWSTRLNTSKVNENRREYRLRQKGWSSSTEIDLNDGELNGDCSTSHLRNVRRRGLDARYRNGDRHRDTSLTVEIVWRQKSTTKLWARSAACIRSLAKLSFMTFSVAKPANWLYCCLTD